MTNPTTITPAALPSLPVDERAALPDTPAVYFVLEGDIIDAADDNDTTTTTTRTVSRLEPRELSPIETAQRLRSELRERYPASHFSVRCRTGYCCSSVRVTYNDGPSQDDVRMLANAYLGYSYESLGLGDDGDYRPLPGRWVGGEFIRYGLTSISIDRDTSAQCAETPAYIEKWYFDSPATNLAIAEAYLGLSRAAVVKLIKAGTIKAARGRGNQWTIDVASLRAYANRPEETARL